MFSGMKRGVKLKVSRIKAREVNSVLALAASLVLTGMTPEACESLLSDFYSSVRKSIGTILH